MLFSSPPLSPSESPAGNGMDMGGPWYQPLACACPHLLHLPLCGLLQPQQASPHRWTNPTAPVPSLFCFPQAGVPFSPTHPPRLSSYTPPPWGCLLRRLHSTDHPDTMTLTQPLAQLVSCVVFPSHTVDWEPGKPKGCVQLPQPLQCPTQEPPLEIQGFPSATILSPDF